MRVPIVVILVVGLFVSREHQPVLANFPVETKDLSDGTVIDGYAKYGDYIGVPETGGFSQTIVQDVQIRFIDDNNQSVDEQGKPIIGRTQKDFILGLLKLKPGQIFREEALQADLRRLRKLESFTYVRAYREENPFGVNIIYDVKERRFPSWNYGIGNNDDIGLSGRVTYKDANISGLNDQLATTVQVSGKDIQFHSRFTSPYRPGEPERLGYSVTAFRDRQISRTFDDQIRLANGNRTREGRFGGSVALLRSFDEWDAALGLNYTRISLRDKDYNVVRTDGLGNPLSASGKGIDDLFTLSLAVTRDLRDHRLNPTQGSILTLSTEQAIPLGLGNIFSNRLQGNYIQYLPVTWIGNQNLTDNPEMVAVNLQLGTIFGEFPPADAFNLGGLNSVRGYGSGKLASGRSYGLASVEYRFPIVESIGGVVFTDFASDFGSGKTVIGEPGVVRNKPGSGFGYGLGVRLNSPFGLFRGDLGVSDQGEVRFEITTGQKF
ncbi:BamA/TamA family outer membrane protein [Nostoc parmelioides]|uniref:BamA/TamA family outer membrane protein n=1 Tax=Nostoc parmelioides FACHB-3921 TaxID=2692909 RepID=A0ABR8BEP0_9NOSO|nr:BamA/TamA family outer membrane protein [Nostoc parmelioides]MBD2252154.1 BamA/TamA family outer membrane protein [Nostoc parmelioides FACHB-3921]